MIWPGSIPWGGIRSGVLLGFAQGNKLPDREEYLFHGTNKQVYYKIFHPVDEIDEQKIASLLIEALEVDKNFKANQHK